MSQTLSIDSTGTIEIKMLTQDKIEEALAVQKMAMREENVSKAVGLYEEPGAADEMQSVFRKILEEGVSIVAVDMATSEVVAVLFNKIHVLPKGNEKDHLDVFVSNLKYQSCRDLFEVANNVKNLIDLFKKIEVDELLELFFLAVNPKYRSRGIGSETIAMCIEMGRRLNNGQIKKVRLYERIYYEKVIPKAGFAILTSNYTQRMVPKLNCISLVSLKYEDYILREKRLSEKIGDFHKTISLAVFKL